MVDFNRNRRGFLQGTAALSFGLFVRPFNAAAAARSAAALSPNALLRIEADNTVRIVMPHAEMGQGIYTSLAQVLADELDADWDHVVAEHLDSLEQSYKHQSWGVIATGASTSLNNRWAQLRQVGASAREMLVAAAAQRWGVPAAALKTARSTVIDAAGGRSATYGELTAAAAALPVPEAPALKDPAQFTLIGQDVRRLDGAAKASGRATFGMDFRLPDMLFAAIRHAPVFGARIESVNDVAARGMPGVHQVVQIPSGVAVIADSFWRAKKALEAVEIAWDEGAFAKVSSADLWQRYASLADNNNAPVFEQRGKPEFPDDADELSGEFRFPFLAHAPMEPLNATAQVRDGQLEIWSGTQFQGIDTVKIEQAMGIPAANVRINTLWLGGSFGRRAAPHSDFVLEAAQIATASGLDVPIKMIWQREDDIQGGFYRPMVLHRYRVALGADGLPQHWHHRVVGASISKGTPFEAAFDVDGLDLLSIEGLRHTAYAVPNVEFSLQTPEHDELPVCWLRGEADSHTGPVVETIINRCARQAGADPFAYRRRLLDDSATARRIAGVLDGLESASGWADPPAPDVFRGMAVHASFGSVVGYVVELKKTDNILSFHKVTAAVDCGRVINPAGVRSQVFGAAAFALSMALGQQITIRNGSAHESNFHDYPVARLADVPDVDVHLVDNGLDYPTGVGEPGVPPLIPALTEAIYAATGQETHTLPLALAGVKFGRT